MEHKIFIIINVKQISYFVFDIIINNKLYMHSVKLECRWYLCVK